MTDIKITNTRPINIHKNIIKFKNYDTDPDIDLYDNGLDAFLKQFTPINATSAQELYIDKTKEPLETIKDLHLQVLTEDSAQTDIDEKLTILYSEIAMNKPKSIEYWKYHIAYSHLIENNYPVPDINNYYTFNVDVQNQAKQYFTTQDPDDKKALILGLTGTLVQKNSSNGILYILTENDEYKAIQDEIMKKAQNTQITNTITLATDIQAIDLDKKDVFTAWAVGANIEAYSINRIILDTLYHLNPDNISEIIPINAMSYTIPNTICFINLENLINSSNLSFNDEISSIKIAQNKMNALKIKSMKSIKNAKQISNSTGTSQKFSRRKTNNEMAARAKNQPFKRKKLSTKLQAKQLKKIMNAYVSKIETSNTFKTKKRTYMRPNRRHPDNINLKGRTTKKAYRPNIHIYLDTSGSVTEAQYINAIKMIIAITQILKVDLFFTSFSHIISQPVKLHTKNASTKQVYQQISMLPKVSGGTEYEQVWHMIDQLDIQNKYQNKSKQINFIITDFEYSVRNSYNPNPNNPSIKDTYYLPLAENQSQFNYVTDLANLFADALIDKNIFNIRSKIIL